MTVTTSEPVAPAQSQSQTSSRTNPTSKRHEEYQYLDLVRQILDEGELREDRTGTGTYSIFAPTPLKFALSRPSSYSSSGSSSDPSSPDYTYTPILPLLTTKRVFTKAVLLELLWFISASTSSTTLSAQGVKIWDGNGSRAFLDMLGLSHRKEGDLGPVYGFQWRHFGAEYVDCETDYTGQGVDQLQRIIDTLRNNPYDRRLILSAWNPKDMSQMVLPPCHMFAQFYVSYPGSRTRGGATQAQKKEGELDTPPKEKKPRGHLHCQLYQRSCDMGLGVPFNIASYALLTHMLAHVCDLVPGSLTHVMGDAHVYLNHVDALKTQLEREPREFPTLEIQREKGGSIDGWKAEDFVIRGYEPHKTIAMEMSV
ncbi:thymidylate synthase [Neurospora crassa]|nr:thymidylate synthase [Neurospora crassa]